MNITPINHSSAQPSTSLPVTPRFPRSEASKNIGQGLLSMISGLERRGESGYENIRPRSMQALVPGRKADGEGAINHLFTCDRDLMSSLHAIASKCPQLMDDVSYLHENKIQISLSHMDPDRVKEDVHGMLARTPTALKCVLSDEHHGENPSLYVREGVGGRPPEIVYGSSRKEAIPPNDLAFAIHFVSEWQKNHQVWPSIYAYFQPPRDVPPELMSGIDEMPIARLRQRGDVCDLSGAGFKPYHGESAPDKVVARIITIKAAQGDNKPVANAIEAQTQPGDVVFVDNGGPGAGAILGGIIGSLAAKARGIKGILIYGEVRDQVELKNLAIPVFGLGCSPTGPSKVGPGSVHCSLNIGNIPFKSGDIVKIDHDQIVIVPRENAAAILASRGSEDEVTTARNAPFAPGGDPPMRFRKTFESTERSSAKSRARPETPSFIPQLFKEFAPAQICDSASFMDPNRLWGAGTDVALRMGAIPDGVTLVGEAVLSGGSEEGIVAALNNAKKGDFLIVSDESGAQLTAAVMEKILASGINCIVVDGKAVIDEGVRKKYEIPCFAKEIGVADGLNQEGGKKGSPALERVEMADGFVIKPGYVMMADADGVAGFSPTKFSTLYRTAARKSMQEKAAEDKIKSGQSSGYLYPLPQGSIVTDRYYEPFVHVTIDQVPFLPTSRGIAAMKVPAEPTVVQVSSRDQKRILGSDEVVGGFPHKIMPHGEDPMTFTLRSAEGEIREVEGVSGRGLFQVALAVERKEAIEVRGDGSIVKR